MDKEKKGDAQESSDIAKMLSVSKETSPSKESPSSKAKPSSKETRSSSTTPQPLSVEYFLGCGRYQAMHFVLSQLVTFCQAFNMSMMTFGKVVPKWTCQDWDYQQFHLETNLTAKHFYTCERLKNQTCQNLTLTTDFESVVSQWGLICTGMKMVFFSMSVQMIGVIVGSQIWGQIADWYGRKWTLIVALAGLILCGSSSVLSPGMTVFTVFRFFIGWFMAGTISTNHVFYSEFITSKHRLWIGCINGWSFAYMFMAFVAYMTGDWKTMTLICNFISLPAFVLLCFMKESPRWLIQKGRRKSAEKSLNLVTRLNRFKNPKSRDLTELFAVSTNQQQGKKHAKKYTVWHLFSTKTMCKHTLCLGICYFSLAAVSYGIMFDTDNLAGNRFLNFFLFATLRLLASTVTIFADTCFKKIGRKTIFDFSMLILLICCITICFLKAFGLDNTWIETMFCMIAIMFTSPMWTSIVLTATEIYPTPIRNLAIGTISIFSRVGAAVTPQILYLANIWTPSTYIIFSILCAISLISHLIHIPETKGHTLPEVMPPKKSKKAAAGVPLLQPHDVVVTKSVETSPTIASNNSTANINSNQNLV